ncbi:hypothetical protein CVT24_009453, partial [Panaeolus cyanescens]
MPQIYGDTNTNSNSNTNTNSQPNLSNVNSSTVNSSNVNSLPAEAHSDSDVSEGAMILHDLVRQGEASRLRRRGAMRLDHSPVHGVAVGSGAGVGGRVGVEVRRGEGGTRRAGLSTQGRRRPRMVRDAERERGGFVVVEREGWVTWEARGERSAGAGDGGSDDGLGDPYASHRGMRRRRRRLAGANDDAYGYGPYSHDADYDRDVEREFGMGIPVEKSFRLVCGAKTTQSGNPLGIRYVPCKEGAERCVAMRKRAEERKMPSLRTLPASDSTQSGPESSAVQSSMQDGSSSAQSSGQAESSARSSNQDDSSPTQSSSRDPSTAQSSTQPSEPSLTQSQWSTHPSSSSQPGSSTPQPHPSSSHSSARAIPSSSRPQTMSSTRIYAPQGMEYWFGVGFGASDETSDALGDEYEGLLRGLDADASGLYDEPEEIGQNVEGHEDEESEESESEDSDSDEDEDSEDEGSITVDSRTGVMIVRVSGRNRGDGDGVSRARTRRPRREDGSQSPVPHRARHHHHQPRARRERGEQRGVVMYSFLKEC